MKNKHLINSYLKYNLLFKKLKKFIILVELKCGTTCNGILKGIDDYFNILINEVIITSSNGEFFYESLIVLVRGRAVRCIRLMEFY